MTASFPDAVKTFTALVAGVDEMKAEQVNNAYAEITAIETALLLNLLRAGYANTETLSATKTLTDPDKPLQFLDPGGAGRDITLPAEATTNHVFIIVNTADAAETLTIKDDSTATIGTVDQDEAKLVISDGTSWAMLTGGGGASVPDASTTVKGIVELATAAETTTGTDATRSVTPDGLAGSDYGKVTVEVMLNAETALTTSDKAYFRIPSKLNGWNLVGVAASCKVASTSGTPTFTIKNGSTSMLSTNLTIDASETDSSTAATAAVIDTANDHVATSDQIEVACTVAGTGVTYAVVELTFQLP